MSERRIIVSGDIPHLPHGGPGGAPCDAVDALASATGISWDHVLHLDRYKDKQALMERLGALPCYVASVDLKDVPSTLASATDLVIFEDQHKWRPLQRARHDEMAMRLFGIAINRGISGYWFGSEDPLEQAIDEVVNQ